MHVLAEEGKQVEWRECADFTSRAEYAQVVKMLGNGRLEAKCQDGETRLGQIRGQMRKKVRLGTWAEREVVEGSQASRQHRGQSERGHGGDDERIVEGDRDGAPGSSLSSPSLKTKCASPFALLVLVRSCPA